MPLYVLNRTHTLRSTNGHIINFIKGEPVWVPPNIEKEALAIGAQPASGEQKDILDPEQQEEAELTAGDRKEKLIAAFKKLETRDVRGDFTGQGLPNTKALEKLVGFRIETKERDALWTEYKQGDE